MCVIQIYRVLVYLSIVVELPNFCKMFFYQMSTSHCPCLTTYYVLLKHSLVLGAFTTFSLCKIMYFDCLFPDLNRWIRPLWTVPTWPKICAILSSICCFIFFIAITDMRGKIFNWIQYQCCQVGPLYQTLVG